MAKKRKKKSINRENLSPLIKLKLNQNVKSIELQLSGDELDEFRKLSHSEKRDIAKRALDKGVDTAIDAEIIDYFERLNSVAKAP